MRTQATRLDENDTPEDVHRLRPDGESHNTTNIRGGTETHSSDDEVRADYESDEAIMNSKTATAQFTYESPNTQRISGRT